MFRKILLASAFLFLVACAPVPTPTALPPTAVPPTATVIAPTVTPAPPTPTTAPITQSPTLPNSSPTRVIVIGLDNYHVSDIQAKMPNLWVFMQKGAYATNTHHTDLPSRTAPDFATIASGQYSDRHGVVSNTFIINQPRVGFGYWDNVTKAALPTFTSAPPWVAFNKSGWDVGAIGWQGLVLESKDEANAYLGRDVGSDLDQYWGVAIHRASGKLEMGTAEIAALRSDFPKGWEYGWAGPPLKSASITLPMATAMLKSGVPFVYVYIENTHQRCTPGATPPCQGNLADGSFDDLLQADDAAFGKFFSDLAAMNVTTANTLFVITTDEQDHYLANYAQVIDTTDLQPSIAGAAGIFYGADADALGTALASRKGIQSIATREAIKALHIASGADARTPTFVAFSDADYIFNRGPCSNCGRWNHGTIHPDITDSWVALVGPGIKRGAINVYSDHVDILPTIRAILGLPPATDVDGVPILSALDRATSDDVLQLRDAFKQLNAPLGKFGLAILKVSTDGARAGTAARVAADARIKDLAARRDALITEMRPALDGAKPLAREQILDLLKRAQALMDEATR